MENDTHSFNKYDFKISDVCHCDCHREDSKIIHCMICCNFKYETYLNANGKIIIDKYISMMEKAKNPKIMVSGSKDTKSKSVSTLLLDDGRIIQNSKNR